MTVRAIGVDPGLSGALALVEGQQLVEVVDMPTISKQVNAHELASIVIGWGAVDRVAVEAVHSMPRQGVASMFKFGVSYGAVLGVLAALERPIVHVTPTTWTKEHGLGSDKEAHRRRAIETWPACSGQFARKKDDGRADAALIALWAVWQHGQQTGRVA